ncbi:extracellular solute-binding protein [Candidatus Sumerlaeota bacterium]|nr:extracellular solute-binding protein [Candidatus Sumerlaeota bacterium]
MHFVPRTILRSLAFGCALLVLFARLGRTEPTSPTATDPEASPAAAIVVWTDVDPADAVARAVEKLVDEYNLAASDGRLVLRYLDPEEFERELTRGAKAEAPPDLVLLWSPRLLEMAQRDVLKDIDETLDSVRSEGVDIYPAAWNTVRANGHLWGVPLACRTSLRFVRSDAPTTQAKTTVDIARVESGTWKEFLDGTAASCIARTARFVELLKEDSAPEFDWHTESILEDGSNIARESFQTLALGRPRVKLKPDSIVWTVVSKAVEKDAVFILWSLGRLPPVRRMGEEPQFLSRIRLEGPWIGEWETAP